MPRARPAEEVTDLVEAEPAGAAVTAEADRPPSGSVARSRSDRMWRPEVSSQLSERALAEYHYVGRDLRNIGQAAALMAGLLLVVVILVRVLGIGPG